MLINLTNHTSEKWSQTQIKASLVYGEIVDMPFPAVPAHASEKDVLNLAADITDCICSIGPSAVLCQGEHTLTYSVVSLLKQHGITVIAACSDRMVKETLATDGTTLKEVKFEFIQYRLY